MSRARGLGVARTCAIGVAWLVLSLAAAACTDVAVISESSACGASCGGSMLCDVASGSCVQCMSEQDCSADAPRCSEAHACVQCLEPGDCGSEERCVAGMCIHEDDVDTRFDADIDDDPFEPNEGEDHGSESVSGDASVSDAEAEEESSEDHTP